MTTIADGFTTCIEDGGCLSVTSNPTPKSALYAEIDIDPSGGIRCTPNGLASVGGMILASPASPSCLTSTPGSPNNAVGPLADGSPFVPDHFIGDTFQEFAAGPPLGPPIPLNTYASQIPTVQITNRWCRDATVLIYLFMSANVATDAGSRFELRSEYQINTAGFVPLQHTPIVLANSPTVRIEQDKSTSASAFVDPYGLNPFPLPPGGVATFQVRTGVFQFVAPGSTGDWFNVRTGIHALIVTDGV